MKFWLPVRADGFGYQFAWSFWTPSAAVKSPTPRNSDLILSRIGTSINAFTGGAVLPAGTLPMFGTIPMLPPITLFIN